MNAPPHFDPAAFAGVAMVLLAVAVGAFLIFLLMREVWCWYWKLNDLVGELRLIRGLLERAEKRAASPPAQGPTQF